MFKTGKQFFLNQSLRVKLLSIWLVMVVMLQLFCTFVLQSVISENYRGKIIRSKQQTLEQVSYNLNQNLYDIVEKMIDVRQQVQLSQNVGKDYFNDHALYEAYFNRMVASGNNYLLIDSMMILDQQSSHYFSLDHDNPRGGYNPFVYLKQMYPEQKPCIWTGMMDAAYAGAQKSGKPEEGGQVIRIIMPVSRYNDIKAMVVVNIAVDKMRDYLSVRNSTQDQLLLMADEAYGMEACIADRGKEGDYSLESVKELLQASRQEKLAENREYLVLSEQLDVNQWNLYLICPRHLLNNMAKVVPTALLSMIFAIGIAAFVMGCFLVDTIIKPLNKLTKVMEENGKKRKLDARFPARYRDEIGIMASEYNHMMDEMQALIKNIEEEQLQSRKIYLRLLQMQIKPHFLYNSLEAARFLVEMKDPAAAEMVHAIGRFYKLSLSGVKDIVALREEEEHLSYYLKILKIRYSSKYDYDLEIEEGLKNNQIVKFSLQPLVENAVYHGVKNCRKKGLVRIRAWTQEGRAIVEVWDNGVGIAPAHLEQIRREIRLGQDRGQKEHIGIVNVHQRVRTYFSEPYGVEINSKEGEYTSVKVMLPAKQFMDGAN